MAEKWQEIYTPEQLHGVQKVQLELLHDVDRICKQLGLTYILYGGSMLGAVRHKGFIPWDDDVDLAMPRADYMRFQKEAFAYLPDNDVIQSPYTDPKTPYAYTKFRRKGTRYIEYCYHQLDIEQGIYLDIYPIDDVPLDDSLREKQVQTFNRWVRLFSFRQCPYTTAAPADYKAVSYGLYLCKYVTARLKWLLAYVLRIIPHKWLVLQMESCMTRYNGKPQTQKGCLHYHRKNVFPDFSPLADATFEDMAVKIPGDWHTHLTLRYGNYMEWPPEEQRIGHYPYLLEVPEESSHK